MIPVTAGSHTVNCLIRKDFGTPDPQYFDATVAVVYIDLNGSGLTLPESAAPGGPTGVVIGQ
jgi:hypothetical protein